MKYFLIIFSAIVTATCYAVPDLGFIAYFSLIPYFCIVHKEVKKGGRLLKFYGLGYLWSLSYFIPLFHWFAYQYPLEYLGVSKLYALAYVIVAILGTSIVLSLPMALLPVVYSVFSRSRLYKKLPFFATLLIPAFYVFIEWSYTVGDIAVPWARLCLTQQNYLYVLQSASILGSYFISFIIVFINAALSYALIKANFGKPKKESLIAASVCAAVFVSNLVLGVGLYKADEKREVGLETVRGAAIQGNLISGRSENLTVHETIDLFLEMSLPEVEKGAELLVFPESCFRAYVNEDTTYFMRLSSFAKEHGVTIVFGAFDECDGGMLNVSYCITPDGELSEGYVKQHLVPFGEFIPLRGVMLKIMPLLEDIDMISSDFVPGDETMVWDTPFGTITNLICYDSAFEKVACESVRLGANLITVSTNDSWFMDSAAIFEFNGQSKLRAIETRRYIVRSACSGVSDVIDARGNVLVLQPVLTRGSVSADAVLRDDLTFYVRYPWVFMSFCFILAAAVPAGYEIYQTIKDHRSDRRKI